MDNLPSSETNWQPTYPFWALSVFAWTAIGGVTASLITPVVFYTAEGWGLDALLTYLRTEGATGLGLILALLFTNVLLSTPPGLLSLFLITLADTRFRLHPAIGGAFFMVWVGWLLQSGAGALFGLIFGAVSVGGSAAMLAIKSRIDLRSPV